MQQDCSEATVDVRSCASSRTARRHLSRALNDHHGVFCSLQDPSTEVMVHHGVYEAAKAMYEQMLPLVQQHINAQGAARARFRFTGHSLGGSLAVLLSLMFRFRGVVPASALHDPVYTFGAPQMMCGGDSLLQSLGLKQNHVQSVVISGDLVPRIFSCDFPDQIVAILKCVSQRFRNHSCLLRQVLLLLLNQTHVSCHSLPAA